MAQTTWKQVVLDTADAYREANGSTEKIPVGSLADKVRAGAGTPYTGDNPLTIGQAGFTFPAKTLLKDGLQIINGVNGEDLTDTAADQTTAVEELMRMVNRKIAMNNGEGEYVWKKLTAEGGDFIDFVVSSDTEAYPNGATHTDGYWYELVEEGINIPAMFGFTKVAVDKFTLSSNATLNNNSKDINHTLGEIPKFAVLIADNAPITASALLFSISVANSFDTSYNLASESRCAIIYNSSKVINGIDKAGVQVMYADRVRVSNNNVSSANLIAGFEYTLITAV